MQKLPKHPYRMNHSVPKVHLVLPRAFRVTLLIEMMSGHRHQCIYNSKAGKDVYLKTKKPENRTVKAKVFHKSGDETVKNSLMIDIAFDVLLPASSEGSPPTREEVTIWTPVIFPRH